MAVINNAQPAPAQSSDNGMGFFLGMVVFAVVVFLLIYYGLPLIRGAATTTQPSVTVPDKVDVNVNQQPK